MVTLAGPLAPNMPLTYVTPTAFTFSDGVHTITELTSSFSYIRFATGPTGQIKTWNVGVFHPDPTGSLDLIYTTNAPTPKDIVFDAGYARTGVGSIDHQPGVWVIRSTVADTGSTLSLMTLTLMALGLVARRFQRAAA